MEARNILGVQVHEQQNANEYVFDCSQHLVFLHRGNLVPASWFVWKALHCSEWVFPTMEIHFVCGRIIGVGECQVSWDVFPKPHLGTCPAPVRAERMKCLFSLVIGTFPASLEHPDYAKEDKWRAMALTLLCQDVGHLSVPSTLLQAPGMLQGVGS